MLNNSYCSFYNFPKHLFVDFINFRSIRCEVIIRPSVVGIANPYARFPRIANPRGTLLWRRLCNLAFVFRGLQIRGDVAVLSRRHCRAFPHLMLRVRGGMLRVLSSCPGRGGVRCRGCGIDCRGTVTGSCGDSIIHCACHRLIPRHCLVSPRHYHNLSCARRLML